MNTNYFIWHSQVRNYELDYQRIVNNSVYFNYLDYARTIYLKQFNFDDVEAAERAINIVLMETHIKYKKSLKSGDKFYVDTKLVRTSKLKFVFKQKIILEDSKELILEADSITCCVDARTGKVCLPNELSKIEINLV